MYKSKYLILSVMIMLLCTACNKDDQQMTTISIDKKGAIVHTIVEEFEAEYSIDELEQMILREVAAYQKSNYTDTAEEMKVSKVELLKDNKVLVQMTFPTAEDFEQFQNMQTAEKSEFFFGTVKEAYDAGYDLDITLYESANDSVLLDGNALLSHGQQKMIIYNPNMNYDNQLGMGAPVIIRTQGSIYAISDNVVLQDKKEVWIGNTSNPVYIVLD